MAWKSAFTTAMAAAALFAQGSKIPGWFLAGNNPQAYAIGLDSEVRHSGNNSAVIGCTTGVCQGFATLMQTLRADEYRGRRLRLTAWVKAAKVQTANLWMRVDGAGAMLAFDNMDMRPARGTFDWRQQQIVLDVPDIASTINYGLLIQGNGQAWVDDFVLETVDKHARSTNTLRQPTPIPKTMTSEKLEKLPSQPFNTDFERPHD